MLQLICLSTSSLAARAVKQAWSDYLVNELPVPTYEGFTLIESGSLDLTENNVWIENIYCERIHFITERGGVIYIHATDTQCLIESSSFGLCSAETEPRKKEV